MKYLLLVIPMLFSGSVIMAQKLVSISQQIIDSQHLQPLRLLPENYYCNKLGFVCKKEIQLEKSTKIPLKIRLGSIDYVDKMEGKGIDRK